MSEHIRRTRPQQLNRAHRGQTLIVALAVMFVLFFIGGIFVAQIARNLNAAGRNRRTQDAETLAEAGIRYCDDRLTNSEDGADWRPAPTPPLTDPITNPTGQGDPDFFWLDQGFTRVPMQGGRALVRISYQPSTDDPRSQMLKIESVGRPGDVGNGNDPTISAQSGPAPRLRRELVAYKQIGLTDYLRFITHKDLRTNEDFLGTPSIGVDVATVYGDPTVAPLPGDPQFADKQKGIFTDASGNKNYIIGGGIRDQGNVILGGDTQFYFSPRGNANSSLSPEGLWVRGNILTAPTRDVNGDGVIDSNDLQAYVNNSISAAPNAVNAILPSANPNFSTINGKVRDISSQSDAAGYTRGMVYLSPPILDTYVGASGVMRYRALTRDSGIWLTQAFNTGRGGYGTGIYIENPEDRQVETGVSSSDATLDPQRGALRGSYSLRADWTNPRAAFSHWDGQFYRAPGVLVELLGDRIRLTRSDDRVFYRPDGKTVTDQGGKVLEIPLSNFDRQNYTLQDSNGNVILSPLPELDHAGDMPGTPNRPNYGDANSYGVNVVIMAEGNVRVKGVYGAVTDPADVSEDNTGKRKLSRVHLTIVSGGTAYIEGSIVKGDGYLSGGVPVREGNSTCAILAKDYICVNTTMFMGPKNQASNWNRVSPDMDVFNTQIGLSQSNYDTAFSWGINPTTYQVNGNPVTPFLLLNHAALAPGPSYINIGVNPGLPNGGLFPFNFPNVPGGSPVIYPVGLKSPLGPFVQDKIGTTPFFEKIAFNMPMGLISTIPGFDNLFRFQIDPTGAQTFGLATADYLLGGAAVAPLDVRIEALLYAQEKSFFVIPGFNFNTDSGDTRQHYLATGQRTSYSDLDTAPDRAAKDRVPFYGEPMDVRITIFGAVTENYTASMGDQAAWMKNWGYIPEKHGSSNELIPDDHRYGHDPQGYLPGEDRGTPLQPADNRTPAEKNAGITRGLRFIYDPAFAMPYHQPTLVTPASTNRALRRAIFTTPLKRFEQMLPPIPRLPVCPGLLYFGDSDRPLGS